VRVTPDVTVLAAVRSAGVNVLSSCGEGVGGTCEATVLSGTPDHRDSVLGAADREAGDTMMLCVSRSLDDHLLLDL
jgi:ferredoxin